MSNANSATGPVWSPVHLLALAAALAAIYAAGRMGFGALDFSHVSLSEIGTLLAVCAFLALLIERAVELILGSLYGSEEIATLAPLREAAARNKAQTEMLARDLDLLVSPQDRMALVDDEFQSEIQDARRNLSAKAGETRMRLEGIRRRKKRTAVVWSCIFGVGISLSGFQLLHAAFSGEVSAAALPRLQQDVFQFVDIIVTTTVLAGGAEGIHRISRNLLGMGEAAKAPLLSDT